LTTIGTRQDQRRPDLTAAALAGLAGGAAYLSEMAIDLRVSRRNVDDLLFLGGPLTSHKARAKRFGLAIHCLNSLALGLVYGHVVRPRVAGPGWRTGMLFASLENVVIYPMTIADSRHPWVRSGQLDRYWSRPAFALSVFRHLAYGAALGATYDRLRQETRSLPSPQS